MAAIAVPVVVGVSQAQMDEALAVVAATIPTPATVMPAGVADTGAKGSQTGVFALGDHTHASKARKDIVACNAATYTWVFPNPFAQGVIPSCNAIAECPLNTADLVNVQLDGPPTNVSCKFKITRYTQGVVALVGGVLALNPTPLAIKLHCLALEL